MTIYSILFTDTDHLFDDFIFSHVIICQLSVVVAHPSGSSAPYRIFCAYTWYVFSLQCDYIWECSMLRVRYPDLSGIDLWWSGLTTKVLFDHDSAVIVHYRNMIIRSINMNVHVHIKYLLNWNQGPFTPSIGAVEYNQHLLWSFINIDNNRAIDLNIYQN